jgi:hypothetical protein
MAIVNSVSAAVSSASGSSTIRTLLLAALAVVLTAATADARKGWRFYGHGFFAPPSQGYARGGDERRRVGRDDNDDDDRSDPRSARRGDYGFDRRYVRRGDLLALIPANWREQPPDPDREGRRFVAPTGDACVEFYARSAEPTTRAQHLKAFAFVDGEDITFLVRERDWLVVSGFKGEKNERIFFRKVMLACDEREWRHIAFEYPAEAKRAFDRLVTRVSRALNDSVDTYCRDATVGRR